MSSFLVNLARRGAGLHQNVQPRVSAGMDVDAVTEVSLELEDEGWASRPDAADSHDAAARPSDTAADAVLTGEQTKPGEISPLTETEATGTTPILEEPAAVLRSTALTAQRDAEEETALHQLPQRSQDDASTPIRERRHSPRSRPDNAAKPPSRPESTPFAEDVRDHPKAIVASSLPTERDDLTVAPQVDFVRTGEGLGIDGSAMIGEKAPGHLLHFDAGLADRGPDPAPSAFPLESRTQIKHTGATLARPPQERFTVPVERKTFADPSNDAGRRVDNLIDRLGALIDRLEANQKASQQPPFHYMPQPRQRPSARGFADLASLRRHAARRWY